MEDATWFILASLAAQQVTLADAWRALILSFRHVGSLRPPGKQAAEVTQAMCLCRGLRVTPGLDTLRPRLPPPLGPAVVTPEPSTTLTAASEDDVRIRASPSPSDSERGSPALSEHGDDGKDPVVPDGLVSITDVLEDRLDKEDAHVSRGKRRADDETFQALQPPEKRARVLHGVQDAEQMQWAAEMSPPDRARQDIEAMEKFVDYDAGGSSVRNNLLVSLTLPPLVVLASPAALPRSLVQPSSPPQNGVTTASTGVEDRPGPDGSLAGIPSPQPSWTIQTRPGESALASTQSNKRVAADNDTHSTLR